MGVILQPIIAYLFQIHSPSPIRWFWVALTFTNVAMMLVLMWRSLPSVFAPFIAWGAVASVFQKSPAWDWFGEGALDVISLVYVGTLLYKTESRWYPLMLGIWFLGLLMWTVPQPWPMYSHELFYARLYTGMACFAMILGMLTWEWRRPAMSTLLAALWFVPPMIASASVNWDVSWWGVQVANTGIWTICLVGWVKKKNDGLATN